MLPVAYRFIAFLKPSILFPLASAGVAGVIAGFYLVYNSKKQFIKRNKPNHPAMEEVKENPNDQINFERTKIENTKNGTRLSGKTGPVLNKTKPDFKRDMAETKEKKMTIIDEEIKVEKSRRMDELQQELNEFKENAYKEIRLEKQKANETISSMNQELESMKIQKISAIDNEVKAEKSKRMDELQEELNKFKANAYKENRLEKEKANETISSMDQELESMKIQKISAIDNEIKAEKSKRMDELQQELNEFKKSAYEENRLEKEKANETISNMDQEMEYVKIRKLAIINEEVKANKEIKMAGLKKLLKEFKNNAYKEILFEKEKANETTSNLERKMKSIKSQKMAILNEEIKTDRIKRTGELAKELDKLRKNAYEEIRFEKEKVNEAFSNMDQELGSMRTQKTSAIDNEVKAEKSRGMDELAKELDKLRKNAYEEIRFEKEKVNEAFSNMDQELGSMRTQKISAIDNEVKDEKSRRMDELAKELDKLRKNANEEIRLEKKKGLEQVYEWTDRERDRLLERLEKEYLLEATALKRDLTEKVQKEFIQIRNYFTSLSNQKKIMAEKKIKFYLQQKLSNIESIINSSGD